MTTDLVQILVASLGTAFGAFAGRVFAVEASSRIRALASAAYIGAGAGLSIALPAASLLMLAALLTGSEVAAESDSSLWFDALDVTGTAVLWGTLGGAAGGLLLGLLVAVFKSYRKP